ncbi:hypothetical protein J4Q44_G00298740 [Coregonus suidteri]|uniref:Uncharacterized protein n=1 Tax=Coregonus suidteri TaxID=861788 RepID=A0AAN8QIG2_9TELE
MYKSHTLKLITRLGMRNLNFSQPGIIVGLDLFPGVGVAILSKWVNNIIDSLQVHMNLTVKGFTQLSLDVHNLKTVVAQQEMALDYLLAYQGGYCSALGLTVSGQCVILLPDSSDNMTEIINEISILADTLAPSKNY